jgi:hypothetical protein
MLAMLAHQHDYAFDAAFSEQSELVKDERLAKHGD